MLLGENPARPSRWDPIFIQDMLMDGLVRTAKALDVPPAVASFDVSLVADQVEYSLSTQDSTTIITRIQAVTLVDGPNSEERELRPISTG